MMINEYLHWIVSNNRFSNAYEKLIYFELADRTDENGKCSTPLATLSRASMLSKQTVIKTLRALEKKDFIVISKRKLDNGGDESNVYHVIRN